MDEIAPQKKLFRERLEPTEESEPLPTDWRVYRGEMRDEGCASAVAEKVFQQVVALRRIHPMRHVEIAIRVSA